ncbi:HMG box domain-containing protein [Fusarium keratoplasticum]|uniref:High mobility group protein n=2 Tax=Fusarium solani species complex TaxID=232080 RepID=A0A9W8REG3_9HYPO|nr:HMG box domain-containing protein [Fusarium keratoplasticum]KAI8684826.1 HMG box domain-containing protein [Fusarium keratoplasticum]KAI8688932.1 HMG box domain-containing protein [Fusarium keratoplasticum]KAJ4195916.1 high mobility group protein [Fusarium falciforme]KAJ4260210.1 high mobility group protein [Fusarium falciforme]
MARPKKSAAEKQQPAQVPVPQQQHIQHHQQPLVPTPMMPVPVAAAVVPPPQAVMPQRVVDNDSFLRVRDSAVGRLTTILELLRSFTADYVRQTNLLLGEPTAEGSQDNLLATFEHAAQQLIMPVPELAPPVEEKKERKKRTIDPNAPKRPLTPYFLYMQHARSIIANDLGAEAPKGAVQEEGQRRWANMSPHEKQGWNNAYQYNLRLYNARVHSYKNGNPHAKGMSDEEALKYAEDFHIPMPELKDAAQAAAPADDQDAIAEQLQHVAAAPVAEEPEEEETPAKTPKKATGGRKRKTATPAAAVEEVKTPAPASPDKKRRRTSTKLAAAEVQEEPKKSGRKKAKSS